MSLADQASLLLIPSGYKSQKLYSIFPTNGVGDFDFSRSGSATRIAQNGLITTVDSNVPRLNYPMIDGKVVGCPHHILEPQRTNLITSSESLSDFSKTNITEISGNQITPDGTIGSIKITPTSSSLTQLQKSSLTIGASYSISFFVKKAEASHLIINQAGSAAQKVSYDIGNLSYIGISGVDANIVSYGNEWVRVEYSVNSLTYNNIRIILSDGSNNYPYNPPIGDGLYLWGFQLEQGSFPTSYIPTNGSAVTRSAETANGSGDASTFNDSEGVLMAEISALGEDTNYELISISDGTNDIHIDLGFNNTKTESYKQAKFGGDNLFGDLTDPIADQTTPNKMAIKYKSGDSCFYVNGFKIDSSSTAFTPTSSFNELKFSYFTGGDKFYGKTKQIQYYNSALTDSELETLTSWTSFSDMANGQQYSIQ